MKPLGRGWAVGTAPAGYRTGPRPAHSGRWHARAVRGWGSGSRSALVTTAQLDEPLPQDLRRVLTGNVCQSEVLRSPDQDFVDGDQHFRRGRR